jgi:uncharacterized membrane protein
MMRTALALAAAAALVISSGVFAQSATCVDQAKEKKLAGAAEKSFLNKCQADSRVTCAKQSKEKKLAGAAKTSFEKKCVEDMVGKMTPPAKAPADMKKAPEAKKS